MGRCDEGEVSKPRSGNLRLRQNTRPISSLNEAWFHILEKCVSDSRLSEPILPLDAQLRFWRSDARGFLLQEEPHS
jgi:hypothetical protein